MKKKISKIIISLIIVFVAFILGTVFGQGVKADSVKETRTYYLKAAAYNSNTNQNVNGTKLKNGDRIYIIQRPKGNKDGEMYNIVNQNNTFCIQRGRRLYDDEYNSVHNGGVSSDGEAALAYILCNGGNLDGMLTNGNGYKDTNGKYYNGTKDHPMIYYENNKQQIAIWNYITCNKKFAMKVFNHKDIAGGDFTKGNNLYTDAYTYKTLYDSINPTVDLVCIDGQKVKANYSGMKDGTGTDKKTKLLGLEATAILYKDGKEVDRKSLNLSNSQVTFTETYDSQHTYKCEISCTYNKYFAEYCVLETLKVEYPGDQQTLLTIIKAQKIRKNKTASDTVEKVESKINISMQKYISRIGSSPITGRENNYSRKGDRNYILRNASSTESAVNRYKYENPEEITGGTEVTYTIKVYNNGEEDFNDSDAYIIDRIPNSYGNYLVDETNIKVQKKIIWAYQDITYSLEKENSSDERATLLKVKIGNITKGSSSEYRIIMTYNKDYNGQSIIENTAWLKVNRNNTSYRTADRDYIKLKALDISLQKYIVNAEGKEITSRENRYSSKEDIETSDTEKDKYGINYGEYRSNIEKGLLFKKIEKKYISKNVQVSNETDYKYNNPVYINSRRDGGAEVTYRIVIYNNSNQNAKNIYIHDLEPKNAKYVSSTIQNNTKHKLEYSGGTIQIDRNSGDGISANSSIYIDITYKFENNYNDGEILDNTVKIISVNGVNITEKNYRTADRDYVKISTSSVGLEKTVCEVQRKDQNGNYKKISLEYADPNDENVKKKLVGIPSNLNVNKECDFDGNKIIDANDAKIILQYSTGIIEETKGIELTSAELKNNEIYERIVKKQENDKSHACGDLNRDGSINSADALLLLKWITYGGGNVPVVEVGDLVTYNIKIKNTGSSDIYVKDFYEQPANYLEFYSISGYSANYNKLSSTHEFGEEINKIKATEHITFSKQKIAEGESIDLKITYKVVVPKENTKDSQYILNKAGIEKIYDAKDNEISDVDDVINNISSTSVTTKIYSVKLTKYVSKVKSKDDTEAHGLETSKDKVKYNSTLAIDRKTYPIYGEYSYKKDYKVMVEPGDEVTFTVKVTNTGTDSKKYGKVRTTNITEAFDSELEYVSCSGDGSYNSDKKEITLNNNVFDVNQSAEINIIFRVKVEGDKTKEQVELTNTASIGEIKNVNDMDVEDNDGTENNKDADYLKTKVYQVKLVKYITSVKSKDDKEAHSLYNDTSNPKHNSNLTGREGNPTYKNNYKSKYRVMVEPGDEVTYKIKIVNTGSNNVNYGTVKVAQLIDTISDSNKLQLQRCTIGSTNYTLNSAFNKSINPNSTLEITAVFKVNVTGDDTKEQWELDNQAEIQGLKNRNDITVVDRDGTENNKDADYLKTKVYQVKLVKYIESVKSKEDTTAHQIITNTKLSNYNSKERDRENNPIYNNNKVKENNRVMVEPGDEVTYKIKVVNTGSNNTDYGTIKVEQLIDTISDSNKLQLQSCTIGDTRYTLNSAFNKSINPNSTLEITAVFKVNVTGDNTKEQWELDNQAEIKGFTNRNDITVVDKDGTENNKDADYLKTKVYQVKLVKYIESVKSKDEASRMNTDKKDSKYNTTLTNRENNPTHNNNKAKENNRVMVEPGDEVTFKIKITNTGVNNENYGMINAATLVDSISDSNKLQLIKCTIAGEDYNLNNRLFNKQIEPNNTIELTAVFKINVTGNDTKQKWKLENQAEISNLKNRNDVTVGDKDGTENNKDADYLLTKTYAVKLEKVVNTVYINGDFNRQLKPKDTTKENFKEVRFGRPEHCDDNNPATNSNSKEKDPVTVVTNDIVEYSIIITNEANLSDNPEKEEKACNSAIRVGEIIDTLPDGVELIGYFNENGDKVDTKYFKDILIKPQESKELKVRVKVTEDKMSLRILKNIAEIKSDSLTNRNDKSIQDTTENNNRDADYIQLNYKHDTDSETSDDNAFFAGTVWNDMALSKTGNNYNGIYDDDTKINNGEPKLKDIKVYLYRSGTGAGCAQIVADTDTDRDGKYSFGDNDLQNEKNDKYFKDFNEDDMSARYIKGPKKSKDDNRWDGYYSYYIVFAYDGITYTATPNGNTCADIFKNITDTTYKIDSNAKEDNGMYTINKKSSRKDFNTNISKMVKNRSISYDTKNNAGFIPESRYQYDESTMTIQSSTEEIKLKDFMKTGTDKCLECSKYIGLGLRGRDIFDLELTSEVSRVEVTVNNIVGNYEYTNKVNVRKEDVNSNYLSDMANSYTSSLEEGAQYVQTAKNGDENDSQVVRKTDLDKSLTNTNKTAYDDSNLLNSIYVIYKISVNNASPTPGYATQIVDYYDKKYQLEGVYTDKECKKKYTKIDNQTPESSEYNYVTVNNLKEIYDIYVKLQLTDAKKVLTENAWDKGMATYNMAEIYQYETGKNEEKGQTEYTKGLIDKDSAPGSVATETVRLTNGSSKDKTVEYYFKGDSLEKLKYEDDTYATPTLYFTTPGSIRVLNGTVFEDYTDVYTTDRIRTGNGKQDAIEPGIKGAKVQLIEKTSSGEEIIRYETFTNSSGKFTFTNYLPGNYIMRYFYGDNQETFYIGDTNTKSYNGEDFQATNNYQEVDGAGVHILPTNENYWYTYNYDEGVSTATDIADMREQVSTVACELSDDEMELLNNVRDGKIKAPAEGETEDGARSSLRDKLDMQAKTKQFTLTVEKSIKGKQNDEFDVYEVNKMNFGIAEVPVTTIDLQKHVYSFEIKDSTEENTIASAEITNNYIVEINKHNITDENKYNKVKAALKKAEVDYSLAGYNMSEYGDSAKNENILVSSSVEKDKVDNLRGYLITYSIPNIITITPTWKTVGNVLPGVKATNTVLDVSIEDAKLQGAKLKITYDIAVSMYAEKDFSGTEPLQPSITKVIDLIDNGVSYSDSLNSEGQWKVANASELKRGDSDPSETSGLESYPPTEFTTTIIESDSSNDLLQVKSGYSNSKNNRVTVERVLTSQDTSIQDIITSSIDAFEYQNTVKILQLDYTNSKVKIDETEIKNKDRIRTPERYIIVPGKHHDSTSSETIAIHPPTGDTSTHTMYYIIGAAGLAVLAIGAFGIKKFVLKGKSTKK